MKTITTTGAIAEDKLLTNPMMEVTLNKKVQQGRKINLRGVLVVSKEYLYHRRRILEK